MVHQAIHAFAEVLSNANETIREHTQFQKKLVKKTLLVKNFKKPL